MSRRIIKTAVWLIFLAFIAAVILNYRFMIDLYLSATFEPAPEITTIKGKLDLTNNGSRIFLASSPTLNGPNEFNSVCDAQSSEVSTLGCFTNQKIYLYNVDSKELSGIKESTAAHELLHAIWFRLSAADREKLIPTLEYVYEKSDNDFKKTLETYEESAKIEEIYVRAATQIKNLPENLETHYSEFFKNQDGIVDFYESYILPFNTIESELESLKSELEVLNSNINTKTSEYEARSSVFSTAVSEFNSCALTVGCFISDANFYARRSELIAEESALDELFASLNSDIKTYNEKVEAYNKNVIHGKELNRLVNSTSEKTEEIVQ